MKASGPGGARSVYSCPGCRPPLFLLGRRGGPMASVPSVKWGEIIGPVGTRLCEATSKAPGCGTQCPLSPELVPVFPEAKAPGPADTSGRVWATGGGESRRQGTSASRWRGLRGRPPQSGGSRGDRPAGSPRVGRDGASPLARRWLAPGSTLSLRQARSLPRRQKEASARSCQEEVNSEKSRKVKQHST